MPQVKRVWKPSHVSHDKNLNTLTVEQEPVSGNVRLVLKLSSEKKERHLGEVDTQAKTFCVRRDREKHFMRSVGGYGFNYSIIKDLKDVLFTHVLIHEVDRTVNKYYRVPAHVILEKGKILNFKQQGFELQTFLKKEFYEPFAVQIQYVDGRIIEP